MSMFRSKQFTRVFGAIVAIIIILGMVGLLFAPLF